MNPYVAFIGWLVSNPATVFLKFTLIIGGALLLAHAAESAWPHMKARRSRPKERR